MPSPHYSDYFPPHTFRQWSLHHFGIRLAPYCRVILLACSYRGLWEILSVMLAIVPEVGAVVSLKSTSEWKATLALRRARRPQNQHLNG